MYTRIIQHSIKTNYKIILNPQHEWFADYPWFIKKIEGQSILDLGFMAHDFFTRILCEYGFNVTGVDYTEPKISEWSFNKGSFAYLNAKVTAIPLQDSMFSTIVAPSLLEHLGLGYYDGEMDENAWKKALEEWHRLLLPNGVLLAQVPYGSNSRIIEFQGKPYYKIYTDNLIKEQFSLFDIEEIVYHSFEPHGWIEVSKSVADNIDHIIPFTPCIAKILARKTPINRGCKNQK